MDYTQHYAHLVNRANHRELDGYVEVHHIIPRCMGGDDSGENLVSLTAKEHYVAHQLLVKIHPSHQGLIFATHAMSNMGKIKAREYSWLKQRRSVMLSEIMKGENNPRYGKIGTMTGKHHTALARSKMSAVHAGKHISEAHKLRISEANTGHLVSNSTKEKLRRPKPIGFGDSRRGELNPNYGKTHDAEARSKMSSAAKNKERRSCKYCNKELLVSHIVRYHDDRCKCKTETE